MPCIVKVQPGWSLCEEQSNTLAWDWIRCCTNEDPHEQMNGFSLVSMTFGFCLKTGGEGEAAKNREWAEINFPTCRAQLLRRKCSFSRTEGVGAASIVQL